METVDLTDVEVQDIEAVLTLPTHTIKLIEQTAKEHDSNPAEVAAMWLVAFGSMIAAGEAKFISGSCEHESVH